MIRLSYIFVRKAKKLNVQLIEQFLEEINKIEISLLNMESKMGNVATDTPSAIAAKNNVLSIFKPLAIMKQDLQTFKAGKSLVANPEDMQKALKKMGLPPEFGNIFGMNQQNANDKPLPPFQGFSEGEGFK